jgi:hypothetical protein
LRGTQDARDILIEVSKTDNVRIAYLAALFLGAIEDGAGAVSAAEHWYTQAVARVPKAQAAFLALSELRHRSGDRRRECDGWTGDQGGHDGKPAAFDGILREFRTRYAVAYSPRDVDTPGWHRIDLRVKGRRAEVKARRGYQR